ncbi:MAG: T9SS type A sorting domain-containing protein [Fibrobacterota bacterium]
MAKLIALLLLVAATVVFPYGDTLRCYKIDPADAPVIDGSMADWNVKYKVGSPDSDSNLFYLCNTFGGFTVDYNYDLYLCHTDSFLYVGWQTTVDDYNNIGKAWKDGGDNIKICFGGRSNYFYLYNNDTMYVSPDDPYENNPAFGGAFSLSWMPNVLACVHKGAGTDMPVYEFRMSKFDVGLPKGTSAAIALINYLTEDYDVTGNCAFLAIGGIYTDDKTNSDNNQWEATANFPLTMFEQTDPDGNPIGVEAQTTVRLQPLFASPNPSNTGTTIRYNMIGAGSLSIYDIAGHLVKSYSNLKNSGSVNWNAKNTSNNSVAAGVYVAKLQTESKVMSLRLLITK